MRVLRATAVALLTCRVAFAHDVGADLSLNGTAPTSTNPRSGSAAVSLSGSYDFGERLTGFLSATYLRDFATRSAESFSPGSNIFLLNAGAMFVANEHWLLMGSLSGSPPSIQRNAATYSFLDTEVGLVLRAINAAIGGAIFASYASNGLSDWEHTFDLSANVTHFTSTQQFELGNTLRAAAFRGFCERNSATGACPLVNGLASRLTQMRLGVAYTATIDLSTDVGIDTAAFLYDNADPLSVGVILLRQGSDIGMGTPVSPWRLTIRPSVLRRFGKFSVRLAYQLGLYVSDAGSNHLLSAKAAWKMSDSFRLSITLLGQSDWSGGLNINRGATGTVGFTYIFH